MTLCNVMVFARIWHSMGGRRRTPSTIQIFRQAARERDAGRFEEAAALVARGLRLDPDNIVGHLLAGSLHAIFREVPQARTAFESVLALDPTHPRALLGLARIALEEGEMGTCVEHLRRALARYPDFPEAQALLEVVRSTAITVRPPRSATSVRLDRLRVPADNRELLLARIDATLILAQPRGSRTDELALRTAQLCRLATAMLTRSGLGPLHHAIIEGAAESTYLRADGEVVLSLAFGRDVEPELGLSHLERVFTNCRHELASEVA
jgi:tetratricopeptide (TPR) repeat protein